MMMAVLFMDKVLPFFLPWRRDGVSGFAAEEKCHPVVQGKAT